MAAPSHGGNAFESRIQPLYIIQEKEIRIHFVEMLIIGRIRDETTLLPMDNSWEFMIIVPFSRMVFMLKVFAMLLQANLLSIFKKVYDNHNHNTLRNDNTFKI